MAYRILILSLVVGLIAGVLILLNAPPSPGWIVKADHPLVVGGYGDNFSYSGTDVRPLDGKLVLVFAPKTHTGTITVSITTTEKSGPITLSSKDSLTGEITLSSRITPDDRIITNADIYGDTGIRGPELPVTHALLAGESTFDLYLSGRLAYKNLHGEWMAAQALRKEDGAIRKSGLYYSPLLRDKTGFADPKRMEFTLILHSTEPDPENDQPYTAALQLVFTSVTVNQEP